jgi:hypothetical protein
MPPEHSPRELFDDSLTLHDQCLGAGLMEASYHALAAAMLCAEAASSRNALDLVIKLAHERQQSIDAERPSPRFSAAEAHARGTIPPFESLAATAEEIRTRLKRAGTRAGTRKPADILG